MINEAQALALLDEVNPVPDTESYELSEADIAVYLATLIERSSEVTQLETRPTEEVGPRRNRLIAVAALLMLIIGTAVFVLTTPGEEAPVATNLPPPTTEPAVMAVMDALDAYNSGDIEAYVAAHADDRDLGPSWEYEGETRYLAEVWMNANSQVTVVEPCQVTIDNFPKRVECLIAMEDDWFGPAGLNKTGRAGFRVNSDLKIYNNGLSDQGLLWPFGYENPRRWSVEAEYAFAFWEWLEQEHPDVYTKIEPAVRDITDPNGHLTTVPGEGVAILGFDEVVSEGRDPGDMLIALQYVDEFIAQSDDDDLWKVAVDWMEGALDDEDFFNRLAEERG